MTSLRTPEPPSTGRWVGSVGAALLLHALLLASLAWLEPLVASPRRPLPPPPVEFTFEPTPTPAPRESDTPRNFTELPEDRVDVAPERADALSNVDSRARDEVTEGAETSLPRLTGESEAPAVELTRAVPDPSPQAAGETGADATSEPGEIEQVQETAPPGAPDREDSGAGPARPELGAPAPRQTMAGDPREELLQGQPDPAVPTPTVDLRRTGDSEISQEATANPQGNAPLFGEITLNTMAWEWAPWMQRFTRDFHRNWRPPFAYMMGIIHGKHRVRVEVARDGRLLAVELLEEEGHTSLAQTSLANLHGIAPLAPLPENFPEETLILGLTITYQEWDR